MPPDRAVAGARPLIVDQRRRRFGLDTPRPPDLRRIEREILSWIEERVPDALPLRAVDLSALGVVADKPETSATLVLLLPCRRTAILRIERWAARPGSDAVRLAQGCLRRNVPLAVVTNLPEARAALRRWGVEPEGRWIMGKRKPSAVTLAGSASRRDRVRPGHEDATPERLRHARAVGSAAVDGQGVRRLADPFDVLRARNLLDRTDSTGNEVLWNAGDRFRMHWQIGFRDGLSAVDLSRPSVDGGSGSGLTPTEAALRHRDRYRSASAAVGPRLLPYVHAVVIEGRPVASLRAMVGETGHSRTAEALAIERLREGLHRLCEFWGMQTRSRTAPLRGWREEARPEEDPVPEG